METIDIVCTNNSKSKPAEILIKNDKYVKAVLVGTQITIEMTRQDLNKSYIGHTAGLEFAWQPKN